MGVAWLTRLQGQTCTHSVAKLKTGNIALVQRQRTATPWETGREKDLPSTTTGSTKKNEVPHGGKGTRTTGRGNGVYKGPLRGKNGTQSTKREGLVHKVQQGERGAQGTFFTQTSRYCIMHVTTVDGAALL